MEITHPQNPLRAKVALMAATAALAFGHGENASAHTNHHPDFNYGTPQTLTPKQKMLFKEGIYYYDQTPPEVPVAKLQTPPLPPKSAPESAEPFDKSSSKNLSPRQSTEKTIALSVMLGSLAVGLGAFLGRGKKKQSQTTTEAKSPASR
jgi:hypothetical protein